MSKAIFSKISTPSRIKSISADSGTAFCYDANGNGRVYGREHIYFMRGLSQPEILEPGRPLTWDNNGQAIEVKILKNGETFKLSNWSSENVFETTWSVVEGRLIQRP